MERAGVDLGLFLESGGDLLRPAWNPVRLDRQGTLELRGLDSNLPETTLAAFELVPAAVARTREDGLTVTPDGDTPAFEVSGDRLLVPAFGHPSGEIFHAAAAGGIDDPAMTAYLDSILQFVESPGGRLERLRGRRTQERRLPDYGGEDPRGPSRRGRPAFPRGRATPHPAGLRRAGATGWKPR